MEYYLMSNDTDEKIVGEEYPQCKGIPSKMGLTYKWFDQPNSMTKLTNDDFPDFEPKLIFELEEKAILTDVVSPSNISAKGFLINQKVKDASVQFNLMEHKYYPATLIVQNDKLQYYWVHFKGNEDYFLNNIDFKKSVFYIGNLARWKEADIALNSIEEYKEARKNIGFKTINFEKLHLSNSFKKNPKDLFYIDSLLNDFIISDTLRNKLQVLSITGLRVSKPNFIIE